MTSDMRILAVIPARKNSRGLPGKNIRPFRGQPLALRAVQCARIAGCFDAIALSTDDDRLLEMLRKQNLSDVSSIRRPDPLAEDLARIEPALLHALDWFESAGVPPFHAVALLEPTSPLRNPETIRSCVAAFRAGSVASLVTVVESREYLWKRSANAGYEPIWNAPRRRQEREPHFIEAGIIYLSRVESLRATGTLISSAPMAVNVPRREAVDINDETDFHLAEYLAALNEGKQ